MAFDIKSARPVSGGFDLSSARLVNQPKLSPVAASYFQTSGAPLGPQVTPFLNKKALPKGVTTKEIAKRRRVDKFSEPEDFMPVINVDRNNAVLTSPTPGTVPLDQSTIDTLIDFENDEGFLDRAASYARQGMAGLNSGAARVRGAVQEFDASNPLPWTSAENIDRAEAIVDEARRAARQEEIIAGRPIAGKVGLEEIVANPLDLTQYPEGLVNLAANSLPYMVGAKLAPVLTTAALSGSLGQQRAENNARQDATLQDIALAAPAAAVSAAAERLGIEGILGAAGANAATRVAKAGIGEGLSEIASSSAEYAGGSLGTDRGYSPAEAARQAAYGFLGGSFLGSGLRGVYEVGAKAAGVSQSELPPSPSEPPAPAAERPAAPPPPPPAPAPVDLAQKLGAVGSKIILKEPGGVNEYTYRGMDEDGRVIIEAKDGSIFAEDPAEISEAIDIGAAIPTGVDETPVPGVAFGEEEVEPAPAVAPEPEPAPAPATVAMPRAPSYVAENAQSTVEMLRQKNPSVLKTVTDLHAEDMTAAEIAAATNLDVDTVRDVRLGLGLPDQGKGTTGIGGAGAPADPQERAAFEAWRNNYKAENESPAPEPAPVPAPVPSKPGPMPLPLAKDAKDVIGEYSQDRSTEDLQQIMSIASDLARQYGKRSITKDVLFKAGQRFDGIPPVEAPQAPAKPEGKFTVTLPPAAEPATDFGPDLKRIMGLFHPSIREGFRLPEIKKGIEEGVPFKASDLPGALYRNLNPADRKIMEQALIENPQQVLDAAQITPFKTPTGEVVRNTSPDTGADLPIDESNLKSMKEMQRTRTPAFMADLEKEARQIASNEGASSVSSLHFAEALNNSASRLNGRKVPFAGDWRESLSEAFNEPKKKSKAAPAPAAPRAVGNKATVTIPATRNKVEVQDELLDLADVKFAEGELQNRDRSRPQTQQFLRRFTSEFDPEGLGEDRSTDRGAPIINKDNVILSGNGRTMGLEEIYEKYPEQAEKYRQFLRDSGWNIEGIERPFLARRLLSDVDEREFVTGSNEADIAALSPPEQAAQDAQDILKPAVLAKYNGGDLKAAKNDAFISAFLAEMSPQQRENAMDDKGNISAQALKRIENALLYKAYGQAGRASDIFISKAMERSDDDTKTLTNALVDVAKDWIKFQQAVKNGEVDKKYDITGKLMETVGTVSDIKTSGTKLSDALRSPDMVNPMDPFVRDILLSFYNDNLTRMLSKKAIAEKLYAFTEVAANQQPEPDMFGKAETPSARDIWKRVDAGEGVQQPELYQSIEGTSSNLAGNPTSADIMRLAQGLPPAQRVNVRASLDKILKRFDRNGNVNRLIFDLGVLRDAVDARIERDREKRSRDRVRGFERAMENIYRAEREGKLKSKSADLIRWLLQKNPRIADDLAISITSGIDQPSAGDYGSAGRLARIFYSNASEGTAVHEVLHHTERMMPQKVRDGIRAAWSKRIEDLIAIAENTNNTDMREVLGTIVKAYYGDNVARKELSKSYEAGTIPYSMYHLSNPSEFWAVNATKLVGKRAEQTGWLGAARKWLGDFIEKVKDVFGFTNNSAIIKGLDAVLTQESGVMRGGMLGEGARRARRAAKEKAQDAAEGSIFRATKVDIDAFRGRTLDDLLSHIGENRDGKYSAFDSRLADRLSDLLNQLQTAGASIKLHILQKGDMGPPSIVSGNARGVASTDLTKRTVDVYLRSPQVGQGGDSSEVILHEALHAVSTGIILAVKNGRGTPEMVKFVKELNDLRNKVVQHFNARVKKLGKDGVTDFERLIFTNKINALNNTREFLAWGMTNEAMQDYLRTIDAGPKASLFNRFVNAFRSLLNITEKDTSALSHLIEVVNPLFEATDKDYKTSFIEQAPAPTPAKEAKPSAPEPFSKGNQATFDFLNSGSAVDMKKAIAKAQEPDNKIMDQIADIQKKNRGCD